MKNILGIIGGVGPLASCYLYQMITENTKASKDQDHLDIVLLSHASMPDRTSYILDHSRENPYPLLLEDCKTLERMGAKMISIPCNTSCYFHEKLQSEINIPINNIIKNTASYIKECGYKRVAILATTGTINSGLYQNELSSFGIQFVLPNQDKVMEVIYDYVKKGIEVPVGLIEEIVCDLDAEAFILGCTELSVLKGKLNLDDRFIDPLEIETSNILKFFNKI